MNKDSLFIKYYITNNCTFSCDYCYRKEFFRKCEDPSTTDIDNMIEHLRGNKIDTFCFIGGEPTISKNIFYTIDKVFNNLNCDNIIIYSNAHDIRFFENIKNLYAGKNINFFLTFHPKYSDVTFYNYHKIYSLFPSNTIIRCMLDLRYIDSINNFIEYYKNYNIQYGFIFDEINNKSILNCIKNCYFNKDLLSKTNIKDNLTTLINKNILVKYYGSLCYNNCIDIFSNGDMKYETCNNSILDNIYNNYYKHNVSSIRCNNKYIYCNYVCNHKHHEFL